MARIEMNEDEMFEIAKSILKPQESTKKLYIQITKYEPVVDKQRPGPGHKYASTGLTNYMHKQKLEQDYEHVIAFFENPANPDAPTRDQVRQSLNELRNNITRYFEEPYYYCDHDIITVEGKNNEETVEIQECQHCGYQPEDDKDE